MLTQRHGYKSSETKQIEQGVQSLTSYKILKRNTTLAAARRLFTQSGHVLAAVGGQAADTSVPTLVLPNCASPNRVSLPRPVVKLGMLNARSITGKVSIMHDLMQDQKLDVFVVTETRVSDQSPDAIRVGIAQRVLSFSMNIDTRNLKMTLAGLAA